MPTPRLSPCLLVTSSFDYRAPQRAVLILGLVHHPRIPTLEPFNSTNFNKFKSDTLNTSYIMGSLFSCGNQTTPGPPVNQNPTLPASSKSEAQPQTPTRRGKPAPLDAPVSPNPTRRDNPISPDAPVDQNPTHPTSSQPEAPGAQAPNTFRSETPTHLSLEAGGYKHTSISSSKWSGLKNVEHLFIQPRRLKIKEGSQVGAGGFGEVMLATLDKSTEVAVKQLKIPGLIGSQERLALRLARELRIWATLQHPNILGLLGYYLSKDYEIAQLVSVYMVNGNVSQYLDKNQPVDIVTRLKFVQGVTSGLQYLHEFNPPVCHGDLKPANVLISDELDAVICDFGVASVIDQAAGPSGLTTSRTVKGSLRYMSPELLLEVDVKHTLPSDIWAWACTTYEIFTDIDPYSEAKTIGPMSVEMHLRKAPGSIQVLLSRLPRDEKWPITLSEVINDCWNFDSSERPTVAKLIGATKYPISRNFVDPPSSRSKSPVGVTHGGPSAHVQSIKDGADTGYNSGQAPTRGNPRHLDRSTRDNDRGDSAHQPEGSRNGASVDQNPASSQSEAQAHWPPTRRGNQTTPGAPVNQHPTHPTSSQPEAPGTPAPNTFRPKLPTHRGNPDAPVDQNPPYPTSTQPDAPGAQAPNTFRSEPPTRRGNPITPDAPVDQNSLHPTSTQPDAPGTQAPNTFRSEPPTRRGNPITPDAPIDQNPTHPTSSQPEASGAQAPNTFRSERHTRRGNPITLSTPVDQNPTHPTSSQPEAPPQPLTRRGKPTPPGAPVDQNPTHPASLQPETPSVQAPTRRGKPTPPAAPVDPSPTHPTLSQSEAQPQPPTRRSKPTPTDAPVYQNPLHPTSSQPSAPVSVTQENTSSDLPTFKLSINHGTGPPSNSGPDPTGDIPDLNKQDKGGRDFIRQGPTDGTRIDQNDRPSSPPGAPSVDLLSVQNGPNPGSNAGLEHRPVPRSISNPSFG
ncbi:hypothetical protein FRC04_007185 [Tulasnella sp. 424]|nr:hypothetical protein FRC04_007185 [Tulasnella sp. 424]KAG8974621.1 hypothetical protein FRC05_007097 [Tulasnella sp. 425]